MKLLIVGQSPSNKPTPTSGVLVKNSTFDKLHRWADALNIKYFSFINTLDTNQKLSIHNVDLNFICHSCENYDKIIALGEFVSKVLDSVSIKHFKMPHPSPLNRKWNDAGFETEMIERCKNYMENP